MWRWARRTFGAAIGRMAAERARRRALAILLRRNDRRLLSDAGLDPLPHTLMLRQATNEDGAQNALRSPGDDT